MAPSVVAPAGGAQRDQAAEEEAGSPLGIVPHQIRGFLGNFDALKITGQAYNRCTGCSDAVRRFLRSIARRQRGRDADEEPDGQILAAYRSDAFGLVEKACEDAKYLEELTGLDKLGAETEKMLAEGVDWEEEDGEDDF